MRKWISDRPRWSVARHNVGTYWSVLVAAKYELPEDLNRASNHQALQKKFDPLLTAALTKVVDQHTPLSYRLGTILLCILNVITILIIISK